MQDQCVTVEIAAAVEMIEPDGAAMGLRRRLDTAPGRTDWQPTMRLRFYRARSWHAPRLQQAWEDRASTAAVWPVEWRDVPIVDEP